MKFQENFKKHFIQPITSNANIKLQVKANLIAKENADIIKKNNAIPLKCS